MNNKRKPCNGDYFYYYNALMRIVYDEALKEYTLLNLDRLSIGKESFETIDELLLFYEVTEVFHQESFFAHGRIHL